MNLKTRLCDVHWGQSSSLLALLNVSNQRQFAIPMSSRTQCMHKGKKKNKETNISCRQEITPHTVQSIDKLQIN